MRTSTPDSEVRVSTLAGAALPTASPDADTPTTTEAPTTTAAPAPAVTMPGSEDLDDAEEKKEARLAGVWG